MGRANTTGLIGAASDTSSPPVGTAGATSDKYADFTLGTIVIGATPNDIMQFCRIAAGGPLAANGTVGITSGVTISPAVAGNTWKNETGITLAVGDYAFLTAVMATTP